MIIKYKKINNIFQVKDWLFDGWELFKKSPLTWVLMVLLLGMIIMVSAYSLAGRYIAAFILPVLAGGMYYAADRSSEGNPIAIENLLFQFKKTHQLQQLLIVTVFSIVIISLHYLIQSYLGYVAYDLVRGMDFTKGLGLGKVVLSGLSITQGMLLSWFWSLALLFAIPLIDIINHAAIPVLESSLEASFSNVLPLIIFYIVTTILVILAAIPFWLGMLVLVPVLLCTSYNIFKTIYPGGCIDNA